jgi:hypothetical protein
MGFFSYSSTNTWIKIKLKNPLRSIFSPQSQVIIEGEPPLLFLRLTLSKVTERDAHPWNLIISNGNDVTFTATTTFTLQVQADDAGLLTSI